MDHIGIEIGWLIAILLQPVVGEVEQRAIARVKSEHRVIQVAELHGIDFERHSITWRGIEREEMRSLTTVKHATDGHRQGNALGMAADAGRRRKLLLQI